MGFRSQIRKLAYWTVPAGIYTAISDLKEKKEKDNRDKADLYLKIIKANGQLKNIHKGKRCFIVCNGPSINSQNLKLLKNEIVFSVSNGYFHPDYLFYQPYYHCVPQITFTPKFTKKVTLDWFKEMHEKIGTASVFLSTSQYHLVKENDLFLNRQIHYTYFNLPWDSGRTSVYDISEKIPPVQSVSIMSLMIAMYMGFSEIYLLGTEHTALSEQKKYNYFFETSKAIVSDNTEVFSKNGDILVSFSDLLYGQVEMWKEYTILKNIALKNNIKILNATRGGVLDVFPRVEFETLFNRN